jgi:dCMP deaminase
VDPIETSNGISEENAKEGPKSTRIVPYINGTTTEKQSHTFTSTEDLLDFVTKLWRERWVTTDIHNETILDKLLRRPFFILVSVDAPVSVRWKRFQARLQRQNSTSSSLTLEDFLLKSDEHLYSPDSGLLPLISRATIRLLNTSSNLAHLYATLGKLDLTNEDRLRPSWDQYFMQLASLAAQRSNCMKRRVGCVLVREKRVISTGYNGTPRGLKNCGEGGCPRCNEGQGSGIGLGTCLCIHAEENALLEAGRERIREGAILYCDTCPCLTCSIKITQVGISEVVYSQSYSMDGETAAVFKEAGVRLRQFVPVRDVRSYLWFVLLILAASQWNDSFREAKLVLERKYPLSNIYKGNQFFHNFFNDLVLNPPLLVVQKNWAFLSFPIS